MDFRNSRYIPYYIAGALIIIASVVIAIIVPGLQIEEEIPSQTRPPETTSVLRIEDGVPVYPDIPASTFAQDNFIMKNGRAEYIDKNVKTYTGIDVSSFQRNIDWNKVKADGIEFAIIRVGFRGYGSKGDIHKDDNAKKNIEGALKAGLKVGVYFFSQAITVEEAIEEAEFVIDFIKDYKITFPVVFDWENEPGKNMRTDNLPDNILTDCAVAYCERVKQAGYIPAVYFNLNYGYMRYNLSSIKDYTFWFAQYKEESPEFYYNYSIWQYSYTGKVDGIDSDVDLNISFTDFTIG
ncbi:MAG: glycoside hydrolase family 25 protein [Clostridia bacterium]|nr:glycoside hydrolase family 25 protein [Clostridia bacterium]